MGNNQSLFLDSAWHGLDAMLPIYAFIISVVCRFLLDVIENVCGLEYKLQKLKEGMLSSLAAGGTGTDERDSQNQLVFLYRLLS